MEPFSKFFVLRAGLFPRSFPLGTLHREKHATVFGDHPHSSLCKRAWWLNEPFFQGVRRYTSKSPYFCIVPHIHGHFSRTRVKFKNLTDRFLENPLEKLQVNFRGNPFTLLGSFRNLLERFSENCGSSANLCPLSLHLILGGIYYWRRYIEISMRI